ncbi:MAG: phage virion morphogenesis protein [Pseudomonadota bacterium]|nr:phage virion morphogenesis protein [Pseudomonadota bacterium]
MGAISVTLHGNAIAGLNELLRKAGSLTEPLDEIGAFLDADVLTRFTKEQAPDGTKWIQSDAARDEGRLTLTDKRHLADSVSHEAVGNQLIHGLGEDYAAIHHFGGKTGRNHAVTLPARPILGVEQEHEDEINAIIGDFLLG